MIRLGRVPARVLGPGAVERGGAVADFRERRKAFNVPAEQLIAVDVRPRIRQKIAAVLAHRSEVERGVLPG